MAASAAGCAVRRHAWRRHPRSEPAGPAGWQRRRVRPAHLRSILIRRERPFVFQRVAQAQSGQVWGCCRADSRALIPETASAAGRQRLPGPVHAADQAGRHSFGLAAGQATWHRSSAGCMDREPGAGSDLMALMGPLRRLEQLRGAVARPEHDHAAGRAVLHDLRACARSRGWPVRCPQMRRQSFNSRSCRSPSSWPATTGHCGRGWERCCSRAWDRFCTGGIMAWRRWSPMS